MDSLKQFNAFFVLPIRYCTNITSLTFIIVFHSLDLPSGIEGCAQRRRREINRVRNDEVAIAENIESETPNNQMIAENGVLFETIEIEVVNASADEEKMGEVGHIEIEIPEEQMFEINDVEYGMVEISGDETVEMPDNELEMVEEVEVSAIDAHEVFLIGEEARSKIQLNTDPMINGGNVVIEDNDAIAIKNMTPTEGKDRDDGSEFNEVGRDLFRSIYSEEWLDFELNSNDRIEAGEKRKLDSDAESIDGNVNRNRLRLTDHASKTEIDYTNTYVTGKSGTIYPLKAWVSYL